MGLLNSGTLYRGRILCVTVAIVVEMDSMEQVALEEEKVCVTSGKQNGSVREEADEVSGMTVTITQNLHHKPL